MLKVELNTREPKYEMIKYKDLKDGEPFQSRRHSLVFMNDQEYLKVGSGRIHLGSFSFKTDTECIMEEEVYLLKGELKLERVLFKEG